MSKKNLIIIIVAILVLIAIGVGVYYFTNNNINVNFETAEQNISELKHTSDNGIEGSLFPTLINPTSEELMSAYSIDTSLFKNYMIRMPALLVHSSLYMIIEPQDGKEDEVKTQINNFFTMYEQQWQTYLPAQYDLVKNRLETKKGKYLIYVVSEDNDKVLDAILKAK